MNEGDRKEKEKERESRRKGKKKSKKILYRSVLPISRSLRLDYRVLSRRAENRERGLPFVTVHFAGARK